ncbi:GapA-binding peptide SR1P [Paenibacillus hamazuiensis]|uniref:GapA-binding peptide SR1P n=1 Tax=Paenibacillus hamazuiensis TaxID=2936508 RepID=UPI00200DCBF0|nr:GapA-binding peptide SR1P [Paenibacillus hamazuiensis]
MIISGELSASNETGNVQKLDLGVVICKWCNQVLTTIPTNGVTKIYGECKDGACKESNHKNH